MIKSATQIRLTAILISLSLTLLTGPAFGANGLGISTSVDRNEITVEDQLRLVVTIEGSRRATPEVPTIRGFKVHRGGGTTTQFQMGNGGYRSTISHTFILVPKAPGTFTIPAFKASIEGKVYRSTPFAVKVLPASQTPDQPRALFIQTTVSRKKAFLKEQLIYTWRLFRHTTVQIDSRSPRVEFPDFEGFVSRQFDGQREYTTNRHGQNYSVTEIKFSLIPQEEGPRTISPSTLQVDLLKPTQRRSNGLLDGLFQSHSSVPKKLTSNGIKMEIMSLPPPPVDFSGLVGQFKLQSHLSNQSIGVGESTTLTLRLRGTGSLKGYKEPALELPHFKLYQDKATSKEEVTPLGIESVREFRTALVPLKAGQFSLPSIEVTYFDPTSERYKTLRTPNYALAVQPGATEEKLHLTGAIIPGGSKSRVEVLGEDILPLHKRLDKLESSFSDAGTLPIQLGLFFFPPMLFSLFFGLYRRSDQEERDLSLRRRRLAMPTALKRLKGAGTVPEEELTLSSQILREYIGDMLNLEGKAMTPAEAANALTNARVESRLTDEVTTFLNRTEASQYGTPGSALGNPATLRAAHTLLTRLDKELPS